jgi:hypothetical protein
LPAGLIAWFPMIVLVAVWIAFLVYRLSFRPNPETQRPSVQRRLVDDYTKRQRWTLVVAIPGALLLALNQPPATAGHGPEDWFTQSVFVFIMLMLALMLVLGPGFLSRRFRAANADELSRALRARASALGYVCAMLALSADYLISQLAPPMLASALPLSMAAVFVIPALYYVIADWQASRDG